LKILFLDIDGVLNAHEWDPDVLCGQIHRDKVQLLNGVLRATGARVVLSSAWRYIVHRGEANLAGMDWLLRSHGLLANRLVGVTRPDTMRADPNYTGEPKSWPVHNERGQQIADWLAVMVGTVGVPHTGYAVVDDMDLGITAAGHPFVQTDGDCGLTPEDASRLIAILNASKREAA
jgi:hypothetical protein